MEITREEIKDKFLLVTKHIPVCVLTDFKDIKLAETYSKILEQLIVETLTEGSTVLQALIVERCAFYFTQMRSIEDKAQGSNLSVSDEYKFFVREYNANLNILRQLAMKNLPEQQRMVLAQRTISVLEKTIKNKDDKELVIKALIKEYTVEFENNRRMIPL